MTNRGNSDAARLARRDGWAREQLEVSDRASPAEVRVRFMTLLRDEQFVPHEASVQAYGVLREGSDGIAFVQDPPEFVMAQEQQAADLVDDFSRQLFKMPPDQRQQRWNELVRQCAGCVKASARLQSFKPALRIDTHAFRDTPPMVGELANRLLDMFAMPPGRRAVARDRLLQTVQQDAAQWEPAARVIKLNYPELAALGTELIQYIAHGREQQAIAKRQQAKQARANVRQTPITTRVGEREHSWWPIVVPIVLAVLFGFSRLAMQDSKRPNKSPHRWPSQSNDLDQLRRQMEQMERFRRDSPGFQPPTYEPPTNAPPTFQPPTYRPPTYRPPTYQPPINNRPSFESPIVPRPTPTVPVPTTPAQPSSFPNTGSNPFR